MSEQQHLVDICFQIAFTVARDKKLAALPQPQIASWVAGQLKACGFDTIPCGASWGVLKRESTGNSNK